jgi:hypothetical protein
MTNQEVENKLQEKIKAERGITKEILVLINIAEDRKIYLERGYPSLFKWLVERFRYSEPAAYRRIEAARLIRSVPEALAKIESGEVNLTTLSKARTAIKAQVKATGKRVSEAEVVKAIEGKSAAGVRKTLFELLPQSAPTGTNVILSDEVVADLKWAMDHFSHSLPNANYSDIIAFVFRRLRQQTQCDSVAEKRRVSVAAMKREARRRAGGRCEYEHRGRRCDSGYQVQVDHIVPKAKGGKDELGNFRVLCRKHNLLAAEQVFGSEKIQIEIERKKFSTQIRQTRSEFLKILHLG